MRLLRTLLPGDLSAHLLRFIPARFSWFIPAFFLGLLPAFLVRNFLALTVNLFCTFLNIVAVFNRNLLAMFAMMNGLAFFLLTLFKQLMDFLSKVTLLPISTCRILFSLFGLGHNIQ